MSHTPTPWAVSPSQRSRIEDPTRDGFKGKYRIADAYQSEQLANCPRGDEAADNAAFIVKAVNSHDALVEALRIARAYVLLAVNDDGGIENCEIGDRLALERIDAALEEAK